MTRRCSSTSAGLRQWPVHDAPAWAESPEGAISGDQVLAILCRYRCRLLLPEVPKVSDRNDQNSDYSSGRRENSGTAAHRATKQGKENHAAAERKTAKEKSLRPHSQRTDQQSHERTRGWSCARVSRLSKELDCSLDSTKLGPWNSSHQCRTYRGSAWCLEWWERRTSSSDSSSLRRRQIQNIPSAV